MNHTERTSRQIILRLLPYLTRYKRRTALAAVAIGVGILLQLPLPLLTMYIIDHLINRESFTLVTYICIGLVGILIVKSVASLAERWYLNRFRLRVVYDLKRRLYEHLLELPLDFCHKSQTGYLISRVSGDIEGIQGLFAETFLQILRNVLTLLAGLVMIYWLNVKLALIATALLPFYVTALLMFNSRIRRLVEENREAYAQLFKYLQEHISGIAVLKAFVAERADTIGMLRLLKLALRKEFASGMVGTLAAVVSGFISALGPIILLWVGIYEIVNGRLTLGGLIAFNSFLLYLFAPLNSISGINVTIQNSIACARRAFDFLDQPTEFGERLRLKSTAGPSIRRGEIEFRNVHMAYEGSPGDVLCDVSFTAESGKVTALVGRSGAGKSSVVNLLLRYYDYRQGAILIDGVDIREYHPHYLRKSIGLVTHESFLFGYSIMENIRLGRPCATPNEVMEAAKAAYADDFISELPAKYNTKIGERGQLLSAGQRQRLTLARVFLKNPRILILDEAMSSLDSHSERYVHYAMEKLFEERTVLIISHRLSTTKHADRIVFIGQGGRVEIGDHESLYRRNDGYQKLYDEQYDATAVKTT